MISLEPNSNHGFLFAITVKKPKISKQEAYNTLELICSKIVVSEEKSYDGNMHHHLFLRLKEFKHTIKGMSHMIKIAYEIDLNTEKETVHVEKCKSEKSYLIYITKHDTTPCKKGVSDSSLSFYYNSINWAKATEKYDLTHPFVLSHPQYYRLLGEVHSRVKEIEAASSKQKIRPLYYVCNEIITWNDKIINWWNDFIVNGHTHKKKQLYLFGEPDMGKTTFVEKLLQKCIHSPNQLDKSHPDYNTEAYNAQVFRPTPNEFKYAWQDFESDSYNLVIIDEFKVDEYNISDLKKILAGEWVVSNVKGMKAKKIQLKIPTIIISNFMPPSADLSTKFTGLMERLYIVVANEKLH